MFNEGKGELELRFVVMNSSARGNGYWLYVLIPNSHARCFNTLRSRQNGRRFADDTFKRNFLNENVRISIKISLKFVPKGPINNNPALLQIMVWRWSGDKPLSEPMVASLLTHICVTWPQWVNVFCCGLMTISFSISFWVTPLDQELTYSFINEMTMTSMCR